MEGKHLYGWMEGFFGLKKGLMVQLLWNMLNRRFNFVSKFKRNITYPGQFEINRTFVRAKFWKRLEPSQFVGNSSIKVWSYTNACTAVIAGKRASHLYIWRKESINMFLILSKESNNQQKFYQNKNVKSDLKQLNSNAF